ASYSNSVEAPLVLNFHGYTSNADQQMIYGDFRTIADTAGFLLVHPQGTLDPNGITYWNAGWGGTVNDVGFTEALIDTLASQYNVDLDRVYSTGMSNGGFMSYHLACNLSHRIAAVASVTGSMNTNHVNNCNASHPMPVMQIHGTADPTVPYLGNLTMQPIEDVVSHWVSFNTCDVNPTVINVPNTNLLDLCTAEHSVYPNGNNGVEVEFYKVTNGGHTWPGSIVTIGTTNQDFNASEVIWKFFAKYDINGAIWPTGIEKKTISASINIFPNPSDDILNINSEVAFDQVEILNVLGEVVTRIGNDSGISLIDLESGMYVVNIYSKNQLIHSERILRD
ncbi:MAG: T9SS type A sorting domain-containing protein, partial [Flavobacteriales bacterium]|nr:T9SS type A sorting domain-containing protein [Flavobacteriales bacterium]